MIRAPDGSASKMASKKVTSIEPCGLGRNWKTLVFRTRRLSCNPMNNFCANAAGEPIMRMIEIWIDGVKRYQQIAKRDFLHYAHLNTTLTIGLGHDICGSALIEETINKPSKMCRTG